MSSLTLDDVVGAQQRIAPHIVRTPLVASWALSARVGAPIWLKLETRQHTGSFKARGALNKILRLSQRDRDAGIVAASAGNHALGVAYACEIAGVSHVDLYVQSNASPAKLGKLRRYPVAVHLVGTTYEEAAQAAQAEVHRRGATFVSAYDDLDVAAGQGTIGLEILEELPEAALVVVPVGGGALIGGIATVVRSLRTSARIVGVNPEASPSALLSLQQGRAIDPYDHEPTLAHGLAGGFGQVGYEIAHRLVERIVLVSETEICTAMASLIEDEQVLAEPSGAVAVAALQGGKLEVGAGPVVLVVSGGNVDAATLRQVLGQAQLP